MLKVTFGEINREQNKYVDIAGFQRALKDLKEYERMNNRLPKMKDKGMRGITEAIYRGEWLAFGIKNWNDLLRFTFNKVNRNKTK